MRDRNALLFSILFCLVVGVVPILQLLSEMRHGDRLQAIDLPVDMLKTPVQRARAAGSSIEILIDSLRAYRSSGVLLGPGAYERVDELVARSLTLRNTIINVNCYTIDSSGGAALSIDSLCAVLRRLLDAADSGDTGSVVSLIDSTIGGAETTRHLCAGANRTIPGYIHALLRGIFRETLFNRQYLRAYEKELEDRSIFILAIRPVMQLVRYALLEDAGVKAMTGRNGWLFYRPGIEYLYRPSVYDPRSRSVDYNDKAINDDPVAIIADFRDQLAERNVELMVVIVPGKGSIYPDLLSKKVTPELRGEVSSTPAIINRLRNKNIEVVDLFGPMLEERGRDSLAGDSVYLARDTHWRSRGVLRAAATVAEAVRKRPWYNDEHMTVVWSVDTVEVVRTGDVGVMTGLPDVTLRRLRLSFDSEVTNSFPVWHNYLDSSGTVIRREPFRDDFRNGRIVILGDSFSRIYQTDEPRGAGWVAHLARELSEPLGAIISDGGASTLVREKLARKSGILKGKRLVLWEFVERDLRYGAFGWKKVDLP
ncbi:MAG: hypothetical protein JW863_20395 [Chitinispirillaceae bacterium]|nr:hypothetical protein [Chitinispirillaceae bacterium]